MGAIGGGRRIAQELAEDLSERGGIDIREAFIDEAVDNLNASGYRGWW